jgi:hypothetical protein
VPENFVLHNKTVKAKQCLHNEQALKIPEAEDLRFQNSRNMEMVRLSALLKRRLYPPGIVPGTHFLYRLIRPQGRSAAGKIMIFKNANKSIGNRTRDLQTCTSVPRPTDLRA